MCVHHSVVSNSFDPMDCSPPGSSVHGILQWVAISFSKACTIQILKYTHSHTKHTRAHSHKSKIKTHINTCICVNTDIMGKHIRSRYAQTLIYSPLIHTHSSDTQTSSTKTLGPGRNLSAPRASACWSSSESSCSSHLAGW